MTQQQTERLAHVPTLYSALFERCYRNEALRPERIKAKCLDCCCYQRVEITHCQATACPLWPIRPYQDKGADDEQDSENPQPLGTA